LSKPFLINSSNCCIISSYNLVFFNGSSICFWSDN
jgi:hypothetical protein